ncbi:MAG: SpoIIIAH-like family protein [Firmicutes bacterium]|nr:SpoIIIAH-like family protein [Bacillota bacterium]
MKPIIVRKKTLALLAVALLGIALFFTGVSGGLSGKEKKPPDPAGRPVGSASVQSGPGQAVKVQESSGKAGKDATDFFVNYRLDRERARGQRVEWLREVINSSGTGGDVKQKAQEHLLAISRSVQKEVELENLIRARGFKDAAVLVDDRSVTVVVSADSLSTEDNIRIADMVTRSTGVDSHNILIMRKN